MRVNKSAVRANARTDERIAQCLCLDSWLFWTTVPGQEKREGREERGKGEKKRVKRIS